MKTIKEQAIQKLKIAQSEIRKIIKSIEGNECVEDIIVRINKAQKMSVIINHLILKDHLIKTAKKAGISEKEIFKYYNLIN